MGAIACHNSGETEEVLFFFKKVYLIVNFSSKNYPYLQCSLNMIAWTQSLRMAT